MQFSAVTLARGWLAVALASSDDKYRPMLHRTVHLERHLGGVRIIATDSYVVLHTWVPDTDHELEPEPGLDEVPDVTATAMDPHGRAKGLLAHALKLALKAEEDNAPPVYLRLRLDVLGTATSEDRPQFAGMEARGVVVEIPDAERVEVGVWDGHWVDWRRFLGGFAPVATTAMALTPDIVGRLCKVDKIIPAVRLGWQFGGPDKAAAVDVLHAEPRVSGLVMPAYWDFARDQPRDDKPQPVDAEADG